MTDFLITPLPPGTTGEELKLFLKGTKRPFLVSSKIDEIADFMHDFEDSSAIRSAEGYALEKTAKCCPDNIKGAQLLTAGCGRRGQVEMNFTNTPCIQGTSSLLPNVPVVVGGSTATAPIFLMQPEPRPLNAADLLVENCTAPGGGSIMFSPGNPVMDSVVKEEQEETNPLSSQNAPYPQMKAFVAPNKHAGTLMKEEPGEAYPLYSQNAPYPQENFYSLPFEGTPAEALMKEEDVDEFGLQNFGANETVVKEEEMADDCGDSGDVAEQEGEMESRDILQGVPADQLFSVKDRLHQCKLCHDYFSAAFIMSHWRSHPRCQYCDRRFLSKEVFANHLRVHIVCSICGKGFSCVGNLKAHMRIHTDERRHICGVCQRRFRTKYDAQHHVRLHTGEKPYGCGECDQFFTSSRGLKRHMYTHTGEKPYGCGECDESFTSSRDLKRHMYTHTGEKPFPCEVCEKGFMDSCSLKRHRQRIHNRA